MTEPEIDYTAVFHALPGAVALLTPQLVYADANEEFLRMPGRRTREPVLGRHLPDDFSDRPNDPGAAVIRNIQASLRRVAETGERAVELQAYDVEDPADQGCGTSGTGA